MVVLHTMYLVSRWQHAVTTASFFSSRSTHDDEELRREPDSSTLAHSGCHRKTTLPATSAYPPNR